MKNSKSFTIMNMIHKRIYKEYNNNIYFEKYCHCSNCFLLDILKNFLLDNGLFEMLVYNINCYGKYKIDDDIDSISDLLAINELSIFEIFSSTFSWSESRQGFSFWKQMSDKLTNLFYEKMSQQITVIK